MIDGQGLQVRNFKSRAYGTISPRLHVKASGRLSHVIFFLCPSSRVSSGEAKANRDIDEEDTNESRYLGQNSIAAFLSEETRAGELIADGEQDVIRKDIMPILGLQISSAPYPFMSKEHMDNIRLEIVAALPSAREVLK